ncbi:MAG: restriction endonuclease subunit S [Burkholderiales bacterium]|nr:restriction endonuclease subunit S [Burkholderiales bacterium]
MRKDWIGCTLEDVLTLKNGFAFKSDKYIENGTPVIRISDINDAIVETTNAKKVQAQEKYENYLVEFGDILIAMSGATTGKFGIYKETRKAYQNQRVGNFKLHNNNFINKHYIYYLLYALRRQIEKDAYGGAQPNISSKKIEAMQITLAPLLEQKAIVAKIEQLFSELDNGIANLKAAQAKLKVYRQAVLKKAFSGELTKDWRGKQTNLPTAEDLIEQIKQEREEHYKQQLEEWQQAVKNCEDNGQQSDKPQKPQRYNPMIDRDNQTGLMHIELPKGWGYYKLGEVYEVFIGSTPSRKEQAYWNGNINWVSSGEVAFNKIMKTTETISALGLKKTSTNLHPIGTVLLAMIGEGKTRGQSGILAIEACHNQNTAALRVNQKYLSSQLLYNFFYYTYQETRRIGSGNNQKALNKSIISNMFIPLMSFEEQNQIVQEMESA